MSECFWPALVPGIFANATDELLREGNLHQLSPDGGMMEKPRK